MRLASWKVENYSNMVLFVVPTIFCVNMWGRRDKTGDELNNILIPKNSHEVSLS